MLLGIRAALRYNGEVTCFGMYTGVFLQGLTPVYEPVW